jgi:hypothetical protein
MEKETTNRIDMPIYTVNKEFIQELSESNHGRRLTEAELKRLAEVFIVNELFFHYIYLAFIEATKEVLEGDDWDLYDKEHADIELKKMF